MEQFQWYTPLQKSPSSPCHSPLVVFEISRMTRQNTDAFISRKRKLVSVMAPQCSTVSNLLLFILSVRLCTRHSIGYSSIDMQSRERMTYALMNSVIQQLSALLVIRVKCNDNTHTHTQVSSFCFRSTRYIVYQIFILVIFISLMFTERRVTHCLMQPWCMSFSFMKVKACRLSVNN